MEKREGKKVISNSTLDKYIDRYTDKRETGIQKERDGQTDRKAG